MDCTRVGDEEIAERYLLGRLTAQDRDAFEVHFFECDRCFEQLRTLQSMHVELQHAAPIQAPASSAMRRRLPAWAWAAAAVLVVAIGTGFWTLRRINEPSRAQTTRNPPTIPQPTSDRADADAPRVAQLARVEPPPYIPVTLRSAEDWRVGFEKAMAEYSGARYAEAARGLEVVTAAKPSATNAWFYLGVSDLMLERTDDAIRALQRCIDTRDTAYAGDAQFFLAKAFLQKGDREAALRALEAVAASQGPRADEARHLQTMLLRLSQ
jgi:tetratricopeptide (TPR) repeat protein